MHILFIIQAIDSNDDSVSSSDGLGKFGISSLSHEECMELLIEDVPLEFRQKFMDQSGDYQELKRWAGVTLDDRENVIRIAWYRHIQGGSIDFQFIPRTTADVTIHTCGITGTLDLSVFPASLQHITLSSNSLTGSVALEDLPAETETVSLDQNELTGTIDLTRLPGTLTDLYLFSNKFSGTINLSRLPPRMNELSLRDNEFTGGLDFNSLPETIQEIDLCYNGLSGPLSMVHLPKGIKSIDLSDNAFAETVHIVDRASLFLDLSGNAAKVVSADGGPLRCTEVAQ